MNLCSAQLVTERSGPQRTLCGDSAQGDEGIVALTAEVIGSQKPLLDVVQAVTMHSVRWPLPLQLEDQHAAADEVI